jgi:hypothetical protein
MNIPAGWVQLQDGSYAHPRALGRIVSSPVAAGGCDREKDLHDAILAHCRAMGWPVVHSRMDVPQTAGIGTPDFVIAMPGTTTLWVEAKTAKGKLTPAQSAWIAALRKVGHRAEVVRSMAEFLRVAAEEANTNKA